MPGPPAPEPKGPPEGAARPGPVAESPSTEPDPPPSEPRLGPAQKGPGEPPATIPGPGQPPRTVLAPKPVDSMPLPVPSTSQPAEPPLKMVTPPAPEPLAAPRATESDAGPLVAWADRPAPMPKAAPDRAPPTPQQQPGAEGASRNSSGNLPSPPSLERVPELPRVPAAIPHLTPAPLSVPPVVPPAQGTNEPSPAAASREEGVAQAGEAPVATPAVVADSTDDPVRRADPVLAAVVPPALENAARPLPMPELAAATKTDAAEDRPLRPARPPDDGRRRQLSHKRDRARSRPSSNPPSGTSSSRASLSSRPRPRSGLRPRSPLRPAGSGGAGSRFASTGPERSLPTARP